MLHWKKSHQMCVWSLSLKYKGFHEVWKHKPCEIFSPFVAGKTSLLELSVTQFPQPFLHFPPSRIASLHRDLSSMHQKKQHKDSFIWPYALLYTCKRTGDIRTVLTRRTIDVRNSTFLRYRCSRLFLGIVRYALDVWGTRRLIFL